MKKSIITITMALLLTNCTFLQEGYNRYIQPLVTNKEKDSNTNSEVIDDENIVADFNMSETEMKEKTQLSEEENSEKGLKQENFYLNSSGVMYLSDLLKQEENLGVEKNFEFNEEEREFEIYTTDTLVLKNVPANSIKLISAPVKSKFLLEIKNNILTFNSPFQGEYVFEISQDLQSVATIKIKNVLKYSLDKTKLYAILLESFDNKNIELLDKTSQLYLYSFPTDEKQKEIIFMTLDLNSSKLNQTRFKEKLNYLKENYELTEDDKIRLLQIEKSSNSSRFFSIDDYYLVYDKNNTKLNELIVKYIMEKEYLKPNEIKFLEQIYEKTKDKKIASYLETVSLKNGDLNQASYYDEKKSEEAQIESLNLEKNQNQEEMAIDSKGLLSEEDLKVGIDSYKRRSYNEAIIYLNKADGNSFENMTVNYYRGLTYFYLKNYDLAVENLEKIKLTPENTPEICYYLGVAYNFKGDKEKAKEYLNKSKEANPSSIWGRKSNIYLLKI